jgi:hypothetical protein
VIDTIGKQFTSKLTSLKKPLEARDMGGIRNLLIKALALSQNGVTQIGEDIFYVTSRTKPRITGHVISKGKNGLYTCPCQSYAETNLCSHALAALFFESARNARKNVLTENESIIKPEEEV